MEHARYPLVRDGTFDGTGPRPAHPTVKVTWVDGESPQVFCGDNWCVGNCGLPALIIPSEPYDGQERFWKASGFQVACGSFMQWKRVDWTGARVAVPEEHHEDFRKRMWW